jgi:hypothetical protein
MCIRLKVSASSNWGQWPQPSITTNRAPGIMSAMCLPSATVAVGSWVVHSTSVDAAMEAVCSSEHVAPPDLGHLQAEDALDDLGIAGLLIDHAAHRDQILVHLGLIVHQELQPRAHPLVAGVEHGLGGQAGDALHHRGVEGPTAGGVQHQPPGHRRISQRIMRRHPAAKRFTRDMRLVAAERPDDGGDMRGIVGHLVGNVGLVAPAVADEVDCEGPEMLGMGGEIAAVGLGMAARPVDQD